jgi:hypothetical protein
MTINKEDWNWGSVGQWAVIALTVIFYYTGVVRTNEKLQNEIQYIDTRIEQVCLRLDKVEQDKVDNNILNMLFERLNRIENKLDRLQETKNET